MEKTDSAQLELFNPGRGTNQAAKPLSRALLDYLWSYERTILLIICFIVVGVISFSFGVERGKRTTPVKSAPVVITSGQLAVNKVPVRPLEPPRVAAAVVKAAPSAVIAPKAAAAISGSGYTIQVASYQTKKYAQKEAEAIRKKGLSSFVLSKGAFSVLCVGNFSSQEAAKTLLAELRKQYKGCVIRRL